jgi:hypothetical protein
MLKYIGLLPFISLAAFSQPVTVGLDSASATAGSTVLLNLQMNATAGNSPSSLEWTINAPVPAIQSITVSAGPAATAAAKSIQCQGNTCALFGLNANQVPNGTVAVVSLQLASSATGNLVVQLTNTSAASSAGGSFGITATNGMVSVLPLQGNTGTASFVKTDATTSGTWHGVYGVEGSNIINDSANYPAYVTATASGNSSYTWATSTSDARGMQKGSSTTDRIAACWFSSGSLSIDLRFNDASIHQAALYLLDWDSYGGGRSERVDILDANGTLLDSRSVSGFANGQYLVWNLSGHVIVRITNLNGISNAVLSGLLFAGGPPQASGTASFVKTDATTSGTWQGVYGADGASIINDSANYPAYVTVTPAGNSVYTWAASTSDARGMQKGSSPTDRIAACWYSWDSFSIDLRFNDTSTHQVALYLLDWDSYLGGRSERVDILDGNNTLLDSRSVSGFANGKYLVWNLSGHVIVRFTNLNASSNAVVSGLLFAGGSPQAIGTASFVKTDATTSGTWQGVYGADGASIINDSANYPAYVTATPAGNSVYTWAASTSDARGMQKGSSPTDRIAACWFSWDSFSIDLRFNDTSTHQVALYLLDWDIYLGGRSERVDILDGNGTLLDSRTVSGFANGKYLVWNLSGHVIVRFTNLIPSSNAVVSGLLFR